METELKQFDEQLLHERESLAADHARRRAEFVKQLKQKGEITDEQEAELLSECAHASEAEAQSTKPRAPPQPQPSSCGVAGTENAGKADKCSGCSNRATCSSHAGAPREKDDTGAAIAARMSLVEHKVLVLSGKGGVGKSMVSSQLAFALAARGYSVGLLDIDICGPTVPKMLGVRRAEVQRGPQGLSPVRVSDHLFAMSIGYLMEDPSEAVIWRGPRKMGLVSTFMRDVDWGSLDFLLVDTPPGTSDEHLSAVQLLGSAGGVDGAVVVTSPQDVSVVEVGKEINFCERVGVRCLGVVENFAEFCCPSCHGVTEVWPATSGGGRKLARDHGVPFLGSVPLDPALARLGDAGKPLPAESVPGKVIASITDQVIKGVGAISITHTE